MISPRRYEDDLYPLDDEFGYEDDGPDPDRQRDLLLDEQWEREWEERTRSDYEAEKEYKRRIAENGEDW